MERGRCIPAINDGAFSVSLCKAQHSRVNRLSSDLRDPSGEGQLRIKNPQDRRLLARLP